MVYVLTVTWIGGQEEKFDCSCFKVKEGYLWLYDNISDEDPNHLISNVSIRSVWVDLK